MIEIASSSFLALTLQNRVVRTLTFWFTGQSDHRGLKNINVAMTRDIRNWSAYLHKVHLCVCVLSVFSEDQVISKYQKLAGCSRGVCMVK